MDSRLRGNDEEALPTLPIVQRALNRRQFARRYPPVHEGDSNDAGVERDRGGAGHGGRAAGRGQCAGAVARRAVAQPAQQCRGAHRPVRGAAVRLGRMGQRGSARRCEGWRRRTAARHRIAGGLCRRWQGAWTGTVFVPDMGRRFASRIDLPDADTLRIRGCLWGGVICRSQNWSRIAQVPHG
ncbi:DUF2147 domain-containing protein [Sphingomonas panni]